MDILLFAVGLGLAGFDVFGVVLVLLLLASKVSKRGIILFAVTVFIGTILAGTAAAILLGDSTELLAQALQRLPSTVWIVLEILASILLIGWAIVRLRRRPSPDHKPEDSRVIKWLRRSILLGGIIYAISAFTDPSFLALIAFTSRGHSLLIIIITQMIWLLVSQGLFFGLVLAIIFNKHKPLVAWFARTRKRRGTVMRHVITGIIIICGVILLADALMFMISGKWLLPE